MHGPLLLVLLLCATSCTGSRDDDVTTEPTPGKAPEAERFVAVADGVARDTRTGLEWITHDRNRDLDWHEADRYCRELTLDDRHGWRLPEIDELRALYDEQAEQPCGDRTCRLSPAIDLTNPYVWSRTVTGPTKGRRSYTDFQTGTSLAPRLKPGLVRRVLCVHD
jgi:hypothetical protein